MSTFMNDLDKDRVIPDAIVLSFVDNIQYDYPIPPTHDVKNLALEAMRLHEWPKAFKAKVTDAVRSPRGEYSILEYYLGSEIRFGSEFFYGYGILKRWREGEREKAEERVKKYMSARDRKLVEKLQEILRPELDSEVHAFNNFHKMLFKKINGGKYVFP